MSYHIPLFAPVTEAPASKAPIDLRHLPPDATFLRILGVNYVHLKTADEGDLYLTQFGLPFREHLRPENWYEESWFEAKRERLQGTSSVYKVPTKPVSGHLTPSLDLVVKWSRVGQDVPLDTFTFNKAINAEFNTPFEEFNLVEELRAGQYGPPDLQILTQKPLAIYVPPEKMQLWQSGRSREKILHKVARHPGVEIDILRSYILLYAWIDGLNAVEAYASSWLEPHQQKQELDRVTHWVNHELEQKGFMVADNKPTHIIVRMDKGKIHQRHDRMVYALIDYELLNRTPDHEDSVRASLRTRYLHLQKNRFAPKHPLDFSSHVSQTQLMNVPYIYGHTESTNGALWVVGSDPELFNYFLPERWRTRQVKLSPTNQTYYTLTKDRIHLVWKVSRVGELPPGDFDDPRYEKLLFQGYNSPFEEFSLAMEMSRKGIRTAYPRAIYMTGNEVHLEACIIDERRFECSKTFLAPDGKSALRLDRDYITIWGYWRGLEDDEAPGEVGYWTPIDADQAAIKGLIDPAMLGQIIQRQRADLATSGFEDTNLTGEHILLSYIPDGGIKRDRAGFPERRHCNFEMVRKL